MAHACRFAREALGRGCARFGMGAGLNSGTSNPRLTPASGSSAFSVWDPAIGIEVLNRYREAPNGARFSGVETIEIG